MLLRTLQHHGRGDKLRQPVEMKQRVSPGLCSRFDLRLTKRLSPQHIGIADYGGGQSRDPRLCAEPLEVPPEERE